MSQGELFRSRVSQCQRLLDLLMSRGSVMLPEIMNLRIASHTRRISDLRKIGFGIDCHKFRLGEQMRTAYELDRSTVTPERLAMLKKAA